MFKPVAGILKFFAALLVIFRVSTKLFWWPNKIIFRSAFSKILDSSAKSFFPCYNALELEMNKFFFYSLLFSHAYNKLKTASVNSKIR